MREEVESQGAERGTSGLQGWISNRDAMKTLGLSRPTLQRYRSKGTLPHSRLGGNVYYKRSDIEAILEANLRVGTSDEVVE